MLYVQEYPSPEFRYLKTLLERGLKQAGGGKAIQLTTVLQEADLEYVELDESAQRVFPVNRDELFAYDVVIFGDVNPSYLSRPVLENLAAFVKERGGGMVFIAGPRHTPIAYRGSPLEDLLPDRSEHGFAADRRDAAGAVVARPAHAAGCRESPVAIGRHGGWQSRIVAESSAAALVLADARHAARRRVLVETVGNAAAGESPSPLIFLQFVGAGRVVFHAYGRKLSLVAVSRK